MGLTVLTEIAELRELAPVQHQRVLRCAHDLHIGFEHLRTVVLAEHQRDIILEAVFLGFGDYFRDLLERTEHDHARRIFFTRAGFFLQQAVAEVEILCDIESEVGIERCLPRLTALPIFVVAIYIPVRPAGVEIRTDVVRNVCNHQLRLGDVVGLEVLEVVMDENAFHIRHRRPRFPAQRLLLPRTSASDHPG